MKKPDNVTVCVVCKQHGEVIDVDAIKGFLIHHPGRIVPCRVPWDAIVETPQPRTVDLAEFTEDTLTELRDIIDSAPHPV